MRWILDACTLIYLVKTNLFESFVDLLEYPLVIDFSVYEEVVINGKSKNYPNAYEAEKLLKKYKIPAISIDISKELKYFRDAGETSCFILAREDGICITSDDKAYKKIIDSNQKVIRLDTFYFQMYVENYLTEEDFRKTLEKLESVSGSKPKSILFLIEKLKKLKEVEKNY